MSVGILHASYLPQEWGWGCYRFSSQRFLSQNIPFHEELATACARTQVRLRDVTFKVLRLWLLATASANMRGNKLCEAEDINLGGENPLESILQTKCHVILAGLFDRLGGPSRWSVCAARAQAFGRKDLENQQGEFWTCHDRNFPGCHEHMLG